MKNLLLPILLLVFISMVYESTAQTYTVSGYIKDQDTGETLISANVFENELSSGTISNTYGFYSISLPPGKVTLTYSYIGYQNVTKEIELTGDVNINIDLPTSISFEEVVITADKNSEGRIEEKTQMSTVEVPIEQIKKLPALLGETDVIKALQLLPGVQSGGEGQSGLYVRGGSPDQNLILLDGVPVYNANHLFGFFSVFNADAIKDVKLIKGGFPARYGGRLSSVLEINMKEGNSKEFHGEGSIGIVASKLTLEGPISDKTSFIVSGRRTYIDLLARPLIKQSLRDEGVDGNTGYFFHDINAKINHTFSDKDKIYLSVYQGRDLFYLDSKELDEDPADVLNFGLGWGNITTALRWNHVISPKLFLNTTATFSNYDFDVSSGFASEYSNPELNEEISIDYDSGIRDYALKLDFDYLPSPDHYIKFGTSVIQHNFNPGSFLLMQKDPENEVEFSETISQDKVDAIEIAAYVEDDFVIGERLKINTGLHFSGFALDNKSYFSLQPRFSSRYLLDNGLALKASFATMQQYIHLLSNEGIGLPTDLWLPSTEKVKPQRSWQAAIGLAKTLGDGYEISVEGYYKEMDNLIAYKDGSGLFEFTDWQERLVFGEGESYGAEVFLQKKKGRFNGWIGYTWAKSNRQFEDLNFGEKFPYTYDRRHDISVVATYELTDRINLSGTWVYGTGNAVTLATSNYVGIYQDGTGVSREELSFFRERNNFRMRNYHRMDIGISFSKKKKRYSRTWSFGAYNTYNRKNPFFIYTETDFNESTGEREIDFKQASLFPIIPYVTYSFKF